MNKGYTDMPTTKDQFEINQYISGLSSFITECKTPMTIAVQGGWGSGKSSIMKMVKEELDKNKKITCIEFNTWQFSQFNNGDMLSVALISRLIKHIDPGGKLESVWKTGKGLIAGLVVGAASRVGDFTIGSTNTAKISDAVAEKTMFSMLDDIEGLKGKLQGAINSILSRDKGKNGEIDPEKRIVVFVDDLDRLEPRRAVELLEMMKIFLDCEGCIFVLALDNEVVIQGVKSKYGTIDDKRSRSFLDKIIQVPFKVPMGQYNIEKFVNNTLGDIGITDCDKDEISDYVDLIKASIGSNPRSMTRLFNEYLLHSKIVSENVLKFDYSKKILFALLCMNQSFDNLYSFIVANRNNIDTSWFKQFNDDEFDFWQEIEGEDKEAVSDFLELFKKALDVKEDTIDNNTLCNLKDLLNVSAATATSEVVNITSAKEKVVYQYKDEKYMSRGKGGRNLFRLAFQMITDYTSVMQEDAEEFLNRMDNELDKVNRIIRFDDIGTTRYPQDFTDIITFCGNRYYINRWWRTGTIDCLIKLLGFEEKVKRSVAI